MIVCTIGIVSSLSYVLSAMLSAQYYIKIMTGNIAPPFLQHEVATKYLHLYT